MEFLLLGPVEVLGNGRPVPLGGRQRRTLLAILVVHAPEALSTDRLVHELWGDDPPETARKSVQSHVAHLRRALNVDQELLVGTRDGYAVRADPTSIDAVRFGRLALDAAATRAHDPAAAISLYREALALYRGAPLTGLADDSLSLRIEASRLEEARLAATEDLLEARLAVEPAAPVLADAEKLVAQHPLRERPWALLALGYYRAGRQGDALRALNRLRRHLITELGIEPSPEIRALEQRILDQDQALSEVGEAAVGPAPVPESAPSIRNPYKGLRAFDEADSADFFGRDDLVRRLLERIGGRSRRRLVVLTGPSGAGKSSAVRAGLLPALRDGALPGSDTWEIVVMFPGADPFAALAKALIELRPGKSPVELASELRNRTPLQAAAKVVDASPAVLVIDQFEELFTLTATEERAEVDPFLDLLAAAASIEDLHVVATLRADFLDWPMSHPSLGPLLEEALLVVAPLTDHEVRAAIVEPASRVGVGLEPDLVVEMSRELAGRTGSLPMLQFALADLFDRRRGSDLTLDAYQAAGGIAGALTARAEEIYERRDAAGQEAMRQLFLRLVTVSETGHLVRQRIAVSAATQLTDAWAPNVVEELGRHRLITFDQDSEAGTAVVEVAHEALLDAWPRLRGWLDDAKEDLRRRRTLTAAVSEWRGHGQDPSYLFRGARLAEFEQWASHANLGLTAEERRYLSEGRGEEDALARRRSARRRTLIGVLAVAALVSGALALFAVNQRNEAVRQAALASGEAARARDQTEIAESNARLANARRLAAAAMVNLDQDPQRSILLALQSAEITRATGDGVIREAQEALHQAILESRLLLIIAPESTTGTTSSVAAVFSPDGGLLAVGSDDGVARIYEPETGAELARLVGHEAPIIDVKWNSAGTRLLTVSDDGTGRLWSYPAGEQLRVFGPVDGGSIIGSLSPDGRLVAISGGGSVRVWEVDSGALTLTLDMSPLFPIGVAFDPVVGDRLAVAAEGPHELGAGVVVFDPTDGEELLRIGSDDGTCELRWSPDGSRIATASADTTGRVWNATTGELLATFPDHHSFLCTVDFSSDGKRVVTGGDDGAARVWDAATGRQILLLAGHEERVKFAAFSPDGRRVVTSSDDDRVRIWDVSPESRHETVAVHDPTVVVRARYSPDGELFATSSFTGTARLWNAGSGQPVMGLEGHESWIYTLSFSNDGATVATGGRDFTARLWDVATGTEIERLDAALPVTATAFSPGDDRVAVGTIGGTVHLWNLATGTESNLTDFDEGLLQSFSVAFDRDGTLLAAGGLHEIRLWDAESLMELARIDVDPELFHAAYDIQFSADGKTLLTAHRDGTVRLWDVPSLSEIRRFEGHRGLVWDAAYSPDEQTIATVGMDGTVRLWDTASGQELLLLKDTQAFSSVDFHPDGRLLLVSGDFGARVLVVPEEDLIALAQSRLLRWWTTDECFQYLGTQTCPDPPAEFGG